VDHQNFSYSLTSPDDGPPLAQIMSSTKRKHPTPPPPSSKKRKHKHDRQNPIEKAINKISTSASSSPPQLFQKSRLKIHAAVPPSASTSLDTFISTHLTSTILLKHTSNGTIVAFSNFKSLNGAGRILDECPFSWSWFEGDIVLFNPCIGQRIRNGP
jgi:hypothetical protein